MVAADSIAKQDALKKNFADIQTQLLMVLSGVTISTQFLKSQNAEQDKDIAHILEHFVAPRLAKAIDRLEAITSAMQKPAHN